MNSDVNRFTHFKMYKSGRNWVVAALTAITVLTATGVAAHADDNAQATTTDSNNSANVANTSATSTDGNSVKLNSTTDDNQSNTTSATVASDATATTSNDSNNASATNQSADNNNTATLNVSANTQAVSAASTATLYNTNLVDTSGLYFSSGAKQQNFIQSIASGAIDTWKQYGVLPSVTVAQAIIESAWGTAAPANNLFGIKGSYNGQSVRLLTSEWVNGRYIQIYDYFRSYPSFYESVQDHGRFLVENSRYSNLLWDTNYVSVTNKLQQDGYATSPTYASSLQNIIRSYNLTQLDQIAIYNYFPRAAHLDGFTINSGSNTLDASGWFADNENKGKDNRYVILYDKTTNSEITRNKVSAVTRYDVQNTYQNLYGAASSGFSTSFQLTGNLIKAIQDGHQLQIIMRYTSSSDGNSNYNDFWFDPTTFNENDAYLDGAYVNSNGIYVYGWHAADQSLGRPNHYVFLYDSTTGRELARQKVQSFNHSGVQSAHYNVYGSQNAGFSATFAMTSDILKAIGNGDKISVISRYSGDQNGNFDYVDYWFNSVDFNKNNAWLDSYSMNNGHIYVNGWHAADKSLTEPNQWAILLDATTNKEVARVKATTVERDDVAKAYPATANAGQSGFSADFDISKFSALQNALLQGHTLKLVARYTDNNNSGEGNHTDYWITNTELNLIKDNRGWLDTMTYSNNGFYVYGWQAADGSVVRPYHYVFLYDATTGRELARQKVTNFNHDGVQKAYPNIYGSDNAGFEAHFDMTDSIRQAVDNGDSIQVISRYTNDPYGNGNMVDVWFTPKAMNHNNAWIDSYNMSNGHLTINGWQAADKSVAEPYHWIILIDTTTNKEVARVQASTVKRSDVAKAYPDTLNAENSGFSADFYIAKYSGLTNALLQGHSLKVVTRLSDDSKVGEGNRTDIWTNTVMNLTSGNHAWLDSLSKDDKHVYAYGWHAADGSVVRPYHYVFLYDATAGRELERQQVTNFNHDGVQKAYPNVYGNNNAGFSASFDLTDAINAAIKAGHNIQVISRYTNDPNGNGNMVDVWFNPLKLK
ncbi:MAG: glucosaminidase domain-containing protein [Limosilactobacillus sp.]|uniref:glucosaminidase domain-containing protein n=1 Tax=Limosilactobacillus sp. TaxID=2773925 RepID=UPI0026FF2E9E|nr:glucosaminidase domain-containing protein [Limosilactobacillus sp.]